ncbi:hypothetical protein B0H10DRAFT_2022628 [Mycena sp. CBHHK59/15]|nr:hypothetical protein B0H10DRAFT_2022628 [Mycena sp. CBHHK59/15]
MHITSTINPRTQSSDDIPVVLVTFCGKSKFLPRPESYKEMQRIVRFHYEIDARIALRFEVSSWDVCFGQSVEVTEPAYALLAPLLDSVSVVIQETESGYKRAMPTPSATPPLHGNDEFEDEQTVREELEPQSSQGSSMGPGMPAHRRTKVESEDEDEDEIPPHSRFEDDEVPAAQIPKHEVPKKEARRQDRHRQEDELPREQSAPAPSKEQTARTETSHGDDSAESSQPQTASDGDQRFKVFISGPKSEHKAEFMTRGGHLVRKVLGGACKTFKLDSQCARLMLCVTMEDEDGMPVVHQFECANEETMARSGVEPNARLVIVIDETVDEDEED